MSRISTELTATPHSAVLRPISWAEQGVTLLAIRQQRREQRGADHFPQRGLRHARNGLTVVGDFECRAFGIVDLPEHHRIDVDGHGVLGERLLGIDLGGVDALVDPGRDRVDEGDDDEQARSADRVQLAEAQHHDTFPLVGHQQQLRDQRCNEHQNGGDPIGRDGAAEPRNDGGERNCQRRQHERQRIGGGQYHEVSSF
jgi:hypothetical protein